LHVLAPNKISVPQNAPPGGEKQGTF